MFISEFVKSYAGDAIRYPIVTGGVVAAAVVGTILRPDLALSTISTVKNTTVKACSGALIGSAMTLVAKSLGMQVTYSVGIKVVALTLTIKQLAITLFNNFIPKPDSNNKAQLEANQAAGELDTTDHKKIYEGKIFVRNCALELAGSVIAAVGSYYLLNSAGLVEKTTSILISRALITHTALTAFCKMNEYDTYFV